MLAANVEWAFTRVDWVDTWMYFGFFKHYNVSGYLDGNKKIARLPWILLGYAVNKFLPSLDAALVLHVGCFALGAFYLYRLAVAMFGRSAAVITTLTYVTWVPNHGSGGWDYHNTLLPVFYFTAYRALIWASSAGAQRFRKFCVFGVLFALALHTNIITILLAPIFIVRASYERRTAPIRVQSRIWIGEALLGTAVGGAAITAIFGAINLHFGRPFLFSQILVARSAFLVEHPTLEKGWWLPWTDPWWMSNINMPLIDTVLVLVLGYAVMSTWGRRTSGFVFSSAACAMLEFVVGLAMFALGQTLGHPLLQPFYMAMPVTLPMFLALAALISQAASSDALDTVVVGVAAAAFAVQFVGRLSLSPDTFFLWQPGTWTSGLPFVIVVVTGFIAAAAVNRIPSISGGARSTIACACIAFALGQGNALWPIAADDRAPYDHRNASCKTHEALLQAVAGADSVLFPLGRAGKQTVLWYPPKEREGPSDSCSLAAYQLGRPLYAMGYGDIGNIHYWDPETDPTIPANVLGELVPGRNLLVLITNNDHYVGSVLNRLRMRNAAWHVASTDRIGDYGITFRLNLISAAPLASIMPRLPVRSLALAK